MLLKVTSIGYRDFGDDDNTIAPNGIVVLVLAWFIVGRAFIMVDDCHEFPLLGMTWNLTMLQWADLFIVWMLPFLDCLTCLYIIIYIYYSSFFFFSPGLPLVYAILYVGYSF